MVLRQNPIPMFSTLTWSQKNKVVPANLDDYPRIGAYLKSHYEKLSKRHYLTEAGRKWYENMGSAKAGNVSAMF